MEKKKHSKYVTSSCACHAAAAPHETLRHELRSGAREGGEKGVLIDQRGQYAEIDPFMFSIAID